MCVSLNPESANKEQLLELWHHECDWLFGNRMIDNVDVERYRLAYKTVIKKNFGGDNDDGNVNRNENGERSFNININNNKADGRIKQMSASSVSTAGAGNVTDPRTHELAILLDHNVHYSNLKETESGIVLAGGIGSTSANSSTQSSILMSSSSDANGGGSSSTSTSSGGGSSSTFATDGYESYADFSQIRRLVQTALNEYNKEQQHIVIPLYDDYLSLITRLCHSTQCVGGNCCIVADGGLSPFLIQLVASLMQFTLVYFKASQFVNTKEQFFAQLKSKLIASYYKAGIRVSQDDAIWLIIMLLLEFNYFLISI